MHTHARSTAQHSAHDLPPTCAYAHTRWHAGSLLTTWNALAFLAVEGLAVFLAPVVGGTVEAWGGGGAASKG
jgi:hypothetical protein